MPCAQLHDEPSAISASHSTGSAVERLAGVHHLQVVAAGDASQRLGQRLVGALLVVAERLAVERDGQQLGVAAPVVEAALQPGEERPAEARPSPKASSRAMWPS